MTRLLPAGAAPLAVRVDPAEGDAVAADDDVSVGVVVAAGPLLVALQRRQLTAV